MGEPACEAVDMNPAITLSDHIQDLAVKFGSALPGTSWARWFRRSGPTWPILGQVGLGGLAAVDLMATHHVAGGLESDKPATAALDGCGFALW
jgi:hypothetical protein